MSRLGPGISARTLAGWCAVCVCLSGAVACGAAEEQTPSSLVARSSLPATDRDPLPYTPPPTETAIAGDTVALAAAGGEDQARQMLPALIYALRDVNENGERELTQLFAEEVGLVAARHASRPGRPRATLIQRMLIYARRSIIPADAEVEDLFDVAAIQVFRASVFFRGRELPSTVRVTDTVVVVPVLADGRVPMRTLMGWVGRGYLVVRPGRDPRIVAF